MSETAWPGEGVKILLLDVDGTLTDGGMYFAADGPALKRFDAKDGLGLQLLQQAGVEVLLISADNSPITAARAEKLGIEQVELGCKDKGAAVRKILQARDLPAGQACYMGDDLTDLEALAAVGHPAAPADAVAEVKAVAEYVTQAPGGHGAVREVCDRIQAALGD